MTSTVQEFIKDRSPVATVSLDDSLLDAARRMIAQDFSQLPVVDADGCPIGIITSDSIIKALSNYGIPLTDIRVRHAMVRGPQTFNENLDLFDLFDSMRDSYALVVDDEDKLVGIVTTYDTTEYFRQRAQDIMLVENIENMLKDYVQLAFNHVSDGDAKLEQAIQSMTNSSLALQETFNKALRSYLGQLDGGKTVKFDQKLFARVNEKYFNDNQAPATFDDLTLSHYISLFMHRDHWSRFEAVLGLQKTAVDYLLDGVRKTRNDLAHFREISRDQSYQLRDCYDLLVNHQEAINRVFAPEEALEEVIESESEQKEVAEVVQDSPMEMLDDEPEPGESRYAPLAIWLQSQPLEKDLVKPTFTKIEEIIGGELPQSAYTHRAWWANDSVGHVQSRQWLDVGWRVASVNMTTQVVRFARIKERQKAYIDFYSELLNELREKPGFEDINMRPDGASWHGVKSVSGDDGVLGLLRYSFGRDAVFRVELYINSGDQARNKQLFDALFNQHQEIEEEVGQELKWRRLDSKRASHIAQVFKGQITDDEQELEQLRNKAVPAMASFARALQRRLLDANESLD